MQLPVASTTLTHYSSNNKTNNALMNNSLKKLLKAVKEIGNYNTCMSGKVPTTKISWVLKLIYILSIIPIKILVGVILESVKTF